MCGSQEVINLAFCLPHTVEESTGNAPAKQRISYEALQRFIEQVLSETGYYALQSASEEPGSTALPWQDQPLQHRDSSLLRPAQAEISCSSLHHPPPEARGALNLSTQQPLPPVGH